MKAQPVRKPAAGPKKGPSPSRRLGRDDLTARARRIKLVAFDVDGVLTDGKVTFSSSGEELKSFDIKDGHAIKMAGRAGLRVAFITGRESAVVARRAAELSVGLVYQEAKDKRAALADLLDDAELSPDQVAYLGDDVVDLPVLLRVGLGCAVADAVPEVKKAARLVLKAPGGGGAALELLRFILIAQGRWKGLVRGYFE